MDTPAPSISSTLICSAVDITLVGAISGICETVFQNTGSEGKSLLMAAAEVYAQTFLSTMLYLEGRRLLSNVYRYDDSGCMVAIGSLYALQPSLLGKVAALREGIKGYIANATGTDIPSTTA
jgi:hypothetical protein